MSSPVAVANERLRLAAFDDICLDIQRASEFDEESDLCIEAGERIQVMAAKLRADDAEIDSLRERLRATEERVAKAPIARLSEGAHGPGGELVLDGIDYESTPELFRQLNGKRVAIVEVG